MKHMKCGLLLLLGICSRAIAEDDFTRILKANRRFNAKNVRVTATQERVAQALSNQETNGDEERYPDKRASFGKSLQQLPSGFIDPNAFNQLVIALEQGTSDSFLNIEMGTSPVQGRLVDPQATFAFNFDGSDGWIFTMPPAPALSSPEAAGEMVEVYWQSLLRDIPFNQYTTNPEAAVAILDLNALSDFKGPKIGGAVTAQTLFRGNTPGDLIGPLVSQFLYLPIPYGPLPNFNSGPTGTPGIDFQAQVVPNPLGVSPNDFMTTMTEWAAVQRGENPMREIVYTDMRTFIRNGRDLGDYVHQDTPMQAFYNAANILLGFGDAALDPSNPYVGNPTQEGFVTYGVPDILYLAAVAAEIGLRTAWYQKWFVHRRLRPEFFAFLADQEMRNGFSSTINGQLFSSAAFGRIFLQNTIINGAGNGTYLLPLAYPEGSPRHPSYPAGHAVFSGACATILKAFFNESFPIPNPLQPNDDNTILEGYTDGPLHAGDELNKLAANISLGRDYAGVHYRSDGYEGLLLGEKAAMALLENEAFSRNSNFSGFSLTMFNGTTITIGAKKTAPELS